MAAALVVMGNSIALDNPPIRVAEEFAMLDVLSGGRLIASFGQSACLVQKQGTLLAMGSSQCPPLRKGGMEDAACPERPSEHALGRENIA
jgi:hypothetical protein